MHALHMEREAEVHLHWLGDEERRDEEMAAEVRRLCGWWRGTGEIRW